MRVRKPATDFAKMMRKLRIDLDITAKEMADDMEITPSYISQVETGVKNLTPKHATRIINYLSAKGADMFIVETTINNTLNQQIIDSVQKAIIDRSHVCLSENDECILRGLLESYRLSKGIR